MKQLVQIKLPNGATKQILVSKAFAMSAAGKRALTSGDIGGAPDLSLQDQKILGKHRRAQEKPLSSF